MQLFIEILIGFFDTQYEVNEGEGFVDVTVGVLDGILNKEVMVDIKFVSGTAEGKYLVQ